MLILGAGQEAHSYHYHQNQCHDGDPEARLAIVQHILDPLLHADLAKGHGTGRNSRSPYAAGQQCSGIGLAFLRRHGFDHRFIAGHFQITAQQAVGQPHQRIEPVQCQRQVAQQLPPMVTSTDMAFFMGKDVISGILGQVGAQIDLRAEKAQHKGGFHPAASPHTLRKDDTAANPALQQPIGHCAVGQQHSRTRSPKPDQNLFVIFQNFHFQRHIYLIDDRILHRLPGTFHVGGLNRNILPFHRRQDHILRA